MFYKFFAAMALALLTVASGMHAETCGPDFLIIGAQKSATTTLQGLISQHPQIMKMGGEVHFFDIKFHKGNEWYQTLLSKRQEPNCLVGEKSPYYIVHPYVPERVHSLYPQVKLIMILRNPIDRAYSHYWHNKRSNKENLSFEEAIDMESKRLKGEEQKMQDPKYHCKNHRLYSYLSRGLYAEQIKRWLKYFPRDQLLILSQDALRKSPQDILNQVFDFLNVPRQTIHVGNPDRHTNYPPMKPATRARLVKYFQPYNKELEKLLEMKFDWK